MDEKTEPPHVQAKIGRQPVAIWNCPGCGHEIRTILAPVLNALANGDSIELSCKHCEQEMVVDPPEQRRVLTPVEAARVGVPKVGRN